MNALCDCACWHWLGGYGAWLNRCSDVQMMAAARRAIFVRHPLAFAAENLIQYARFLPTGRDHLDAGVLSSCGWREEILVAFSFRETKISAHPLAPLAAIMLYYPPTNATAGVTGWRKSFR